MKVLITGASGCLGIDVVRQFSNKKKNYEVFPFTSSTMDVTLMSEVRPAINDIKPDIVIHLAGMTDVDRCEKDKFMAQEINVRGTFLIANECIKLKIPLVYMSTSDVFPGVKETPYVESDTPYPVNIYGHTKWHGEFFAETVPEHLIIRSCWFFGGDDKDKKFTKKIIEIAHNKKEIQVVSDVYGTPTYTKDLAKAIYQLVEKKARGVVHVANSGVASRCDMAKYILDTMSIGCIITPVPSSEFATISPKAKMAGVISERLDGLGIKMRSWKEAMEEYLLKERTVKCPECLKSLSLKSVAAGDGGRAYYFCDTCKAVICRGNGK